MPGVFDSSIRGRSRTVYGASIALNCFYDGVDIYIIISEEDSSRWTRIEQVRERLAEL
jgi:hypothetical protein